MAVAQAIKVLLQVAWSEVWLVWHSLLGPLSTYVVAAEPKLHPRSLTILMVKIRPVKLLWTLLSPCNNFLKLLTAKRRITVPTNMLVTTLTHSTTLMIPKRGPKTLGSANLLLTGRLLVRDNSPTAHPSLGNTLVPLSCRVDGMCDWIKLFTCRGDRRTLSYLSTYPIVSWCYLYNLSCCQQYCRFCHS